jgi:2-keto-3-deoxy-galactonokinase
VARGRQGKRSTVAAKVEYPQRCRVQDARLNVLIAPGVKQDIRRDATRGEETQIAGHLPWFKESNERK